MRVAVLNDLHGNLPALEAVLADVARERVDAIVVGGDVVSGPFPAETFDLLAAMPSVHVLQGNADRLVLERGDGHLGAWCADRLGEERLAAVAEWPSTLELPVDALGSVLFCHATPRSDEEIVTRVTPDGEVATAFAGVTARVAVVGHTHVQFDRTIGGLRLVNPVSVGMPYEGRRGAFWAVLGPDVELRRTEVDVDAAVRRIRAAGSPIRDELIGWLLDPPDPDEATAFHEARRGA